MVCHESPDHFEASISNSSLTLPYSSLQEKAGPQCVRCGAGLPCRQLLSLCSSTSGTGGWRRVGRQDGEGEAEVIIAKHFFSRPVALMAPLPVPCRSSRLGRDHMGWWLGQAAGPVLPLRKLWQRVPPTTGDSLEDVGVRMRGRPLSSGVCADSQFQERGKALHRPLLTACWMTHQLTVAPHTCLLHPFMICK